MRSGMRATLVLILFLALAACGGTPAGLSDGKIRLSFEGSVTSASDGRPIEMAAVRFVRDCCNFSGLFSKPAGFEESWRYSTKRTTWTDAAGRYRLTLTDWCARLLFVHLEAAAPGFAVEIFPGPDFEAKLLCTTATQTIDFVLSPDSR